jgi:hypothetical protein
MDSKAIKEVFNELFSHLEKLETQSAAILQFLKEKKRVTDKQLAPYLEQAGNASNVKWRAARVRIERLLSDEEEGDKKIEKKPEIAQAEHSEKKRTDEQSKDHAVKEQPGKEDAAKEQVASPELEAAVNRDTKHELEQKKKVDEKQQPSDRHRVAAKPQEPKNAEAKHEEANHLEENHPTEMTQEAVERDSGKPADEMKPEDKNKDQEAA